MPRQPPSTGAFVLLSGVTVALAIALAVRVGAFTRAHAGARPAPTGEAGDSAEDGEATLREISTRLASMERDAARRERAAVDPGTLRDIVSQAVADQLQSQRNQGPPGTTTAGAAATTAEERNRQAAAFDVGRTLIDARLAARVWRPSDAREIRRLLIAMAADQREEIMSKLTVAINSQELRDEVEGASY